MWARLTLPSSTSPSAAVVLTPGRAYQIAVAAVDVRGNWSNVRLTKVFGVAATQENATSVTYSSGWLRKAWASASGGYLMSTGTVNASASFTFTGSSVAWVASKGPKRGVAKVYLDGVLSRTVDLYAATVADRIVAATAAWPTQGTHTIKVVVSGTAGRPIVEVDAFLITG